MPNSGTRNRSGNSLRIVPTNKLDDDLDDLFKRPLAEFTGTRNRLATRLKQSGRANDASLVKALAKPSVSAWAVNQLYWNHREAFDRLVEAGQRFHQAQTSRTAAKIANMRVSIDARRVALTELSDLAALLLRDAGHNPAPDTIHRITTTLEAVSAYASAADGPTPGRLTRDVDPPGFDLLASFIPAPTTKAKEELTRVTPPQRSAGVRPKALQKPSPVVEIPSKRQLEEARKARIAAAKALVQDARKSLAETRAKADHLDTAQKKAQALAKEAKNRLRDAEEHLKRASDEYEDADQNARNIAAEAKAAVHAIEDAKRNLAKASKELESLLKNR